MKKYRGNFITSTNNGFENPLYDSNCKNLEKDLKLIGRAYGHGKWWIEAYDTEMKTWYEHEIGKF